MSDGPNTWLQLTATLRKGLVRVRQDQREGRSVGLRSRSFAIEKRPKSLSFAEALQSRRRSPWWARVVASDSPT